MRSLLFALASAAALSCGGLAQAQPASSAAAPASAAAAPVDAAERRQVIEELAKALQSDFVFPDTGARYAAMLRSRLASSAYDSLTDPDAFADKVTADLQGVAKDGHLRLAVLTSFDHRRPPPPNAAVSTRASGPPGMEEAKMIGDVAYLRFNQFLDEPEAARIPRDFLLAHATAKAVIIDARPNRGGGLSEMNTILPLLYARRTALVRMDTRASVDGDGPMKDGPNLIRRASSADVVSRDHVIAPDASETRLQHVPVYYLISNRTASAAEHLALAFKRTHRATLVGETTTGAGHFGGVETIGSRFGAFIPVGRSYDPDTGWDWEGKGVAPDVTVPADEALAKALALAKAAGAHPQG